MSAFDFEQLDLDGLTDEQLAELLDDIPEPEPELLLGYARPATRRPTWLDPTRPITDLPPLDGYAPPAPTTARNR